MYYNNTIYIRFAVIVVILFLIIGISIYLIIQFFTPSIASSFLINFASSLYSFLFIAALSFIIILFSGIRELWKLHRLLQTEVNKPVIIYSSNIVLPPRAAYSYNGRLLMFGGWVIAWQEYVAASELSAFLKQDRLAGYPTSLKNIIYKSFPESQPFNLKFQISPIDEYEIEKTAGEAISLISLGSPGSNFMTAYVIQYYQPWFKFGDDGKSIEVARGTSGLRYSIEDYPDLGIIQRVKLQDKKITVTIVAGLTDLSTKMCAQYYISQWKKLDKKYRHNEDFGICLAVSSKDTDAYSRPKEICAYP